MLVTYDEFVTSHGAGADPAADMACLAAADAAVKNYCNRDFEPMTRDDYLDGTGTGELVLPWAWLPVNDVTEVSLDTGGGRGQKPDTFGADTVLTPGTDYSVDLERGLIRREGSSSSGSGAAWGHWAGWPWGAGGPASRWRGPSAGSTPHWPLVGGCVRVRADTGYAPGTVPEDLRRATLMFALRLRLSSRIGNTPLSESLNGYSYTTAGPPESINAIRILGNDAVITQLLSCYCEVFVPTGVR